MTKNYCRNPDNDSTGPWCFIQKRGIHRKQFKFQHCGIPLCKPKNEISVGFRLLMKRDCPTGFRKKIINTTLDNIEYCQVGQEILNKLPSGSYSFELLNHTNKNCPEGFRNDESSFNKTFYCTKSNKSDDLIEFPKYLSGKPGKLIFAALRFGRNAICPQMSPKSLILIRQYSHQMVTTCHYFYKSPINKKNTDQRLAVLVLQKNCPKNWTLHFYSSWIIRESNRFISSVYACRPNKDVQNYPEGDYCLISLNAKKKFQNICPKEFVDVDMETKWKLMKFCCRLSSQMSKHKNRPNIYEFFNFSSILIISSVDMCSTKGIRKDIIMKNYKFEMVIPKPYSECINCDLFSTFTTNIFATSLTWTYYKIQFHVCSYEEAISGFAYATLSSRCPPKMKLEIKYIEYTKNGILDRSIRQRITFCTIVNYPKRLIFPEGQYCIYKIGLLCPAGFRTTHAKLQSIYYKIVPYEKSNNYQMNVYCCKMSSTNATFENKTLPYVTSTFEFGLPYANDNFKCIHGLKTHTAVEDFYMCHYYPTTDRSKQVLLVYQTINCHYRSSIYAGSYRHMYDISLKIYHCISFVENSPPPGNYCAIFSKKCPSYFYYLTYHPLAHLVICCRKPTLPDQVKKESEFSPSKWLNELKSFSVLAYKKKCPIFEGYNYGNEPLIQKHYAYNGYNFNENHRKNLTSVGFDVKILKSMQTFTLLMFTCNYKLDPYNLSITWPHGYYAILRPLNGCPSNFKTGDFTHSMDTANPSYAYSDVIHLDGNYMIGDSSIKWGFCVKMEDFQKERLFLPYGRYCVMKVDYSCPLRFSEGSVKFVQITALNKVLINRKGALPKIDTDGPFITYYFCCQSGRGDIDHEPMYLPTESGSFYLMKFGTYCQKVFGMTVTEEFICIDAEDTSQYLNYTFQSPYKTEGLTPVTGSFVRGCDFQINLCYYEKDIPIPKSVTPKPGPMVSWPKESFVFIKPLNQKCPIGFYESRVTVQTFLKFYPNFVNLLMFGSTDENAAILSFCKRNLTVIEDTKPAEDWPTGNYCFIFEKKCLPGMLHYKLRSFENFRPKVEWSNLCCKKNKTSTSKTLPYFPGDYYSIIKPSVSPKTCSPHQNTRVALIDLQNELICFYERRDESVEFPNGDYLLPPPQKPMNSCAPGFKLVKHSHTHLKEDDSPSQVLQFCQKENNTRNSNENRFPRGNYCILTTHYKCPSGQFTIENMLTIPNYYFADQPHKFSRYLACCQSDDKIISNLASTKVPLQLYGTSVCSYVDGMVNTKLVKEPTILVQQSVQERPPYVKTEKKLLICKYDQTNEWNYETRCQCHPNAMCDLSFGQQNCKCQPGYFGDGNTICVKVTNETDQCGNICNKKMAYCSKSSLLDEYTCFCREGYEGNGFKCRPSCKTRNCNTFSRCILDSTESHCVCKAEAVLTDSGQCHGDIINTIYHLPRFNLLMDMNIRCFSKEVINHLILPDNSRTLFIIYPIKTTVFTLCENIKDYYGFSDQSVFKLDVAFELKLLTANRKLITITKDKKNQWTINKQLKAFRQDIFTNAMVLYLNESKDFQFDYETLYNKMMNDQTQHIISFMLGSALVIIVVGLLVVLIIRKKRNSDSGRLFETRSESNIHFITADEQIKIDS